MCRVVDERSWVQSARREGLCQWCRRAEVLEASVEVDHDCGADAYELLSVGGFCIAATAPRVSPLRTSMKGSDRAHGRGGDALAADLLGSRP